MSSKSSDDRLTLAWNSSLYPTCLSLLSLRSPSTTSETDAWIIRKKAKGEGEWWQGRDLYINAINEVEVKEGKKNKR